LRERPSAKHSRRTRNAVFADLALLPDQCPSEVLQQVVADFRAGTERYSTPRPNRCVVWQSSLPCSWSALITMSVRTAAGTVNLAPTDETFGILFSSSMNLTLLSHSDSRIRCIKGGMSFSITDRFGRSPLDEEVGCVEVFLVVDAFFPVVDERFGEHEIPEIGDAGDRVDQGLVGFTTASCLRSSCRYWNVCFILSSTNLSLSPADSVEESAGSSPSPPVFSGRQEGPWLSPALALVSIRHFFDRLELVPRQILLKNLQGLGLFDPVVQKAHGKPPASNLISIHHFASGRLRV